MTDLPYDGLLAGELAEMNNDRSAGRIPQWWHEYGAHMRTSLATPKGQLQLTGCGATLMLHFGLESTNDLVHLVYELRRGECRTAFSMVQRLYTPEMIRRMFLGEQRGMHSMLGCFPCTDGEWSLFIRFGPYLSLPHPHRGDGENPNLSIYVGAAVRHAVEIFLGIKDAAAGG